MDNVDEILGDYLIICCGVGAIMGVGWGMQMKFPVFDQWMYFGGMALIAIGALGLIRKKAIKLFN